MKQILIFAIFIAIYSPVSCLKCKGGESPYCNFCYFYKIGSLTNYGCSSNFNDICTEVGKNGTHCQRCYTDMCNQKFGPHTQSSSPLGSHNVLKCLGSESSYCDYCYFYRVDNRNYYGCADKRNDVCEQVRSAGHQCQQCYSNECNKQWVPIRKPDPEPTRHVPPSEPSYDDHDALESGSVKYSISISLTAAALSLIFH